MGFMEENPPGFLDGGGEKQRGVGGGGAGGGGRFALPGNLPTRAPPLLRQLAAIGNNLNQTARKVNSGQWSSGDRVQVVAALMAIGDELRRLRLAVREQGARDDS